ncbi:MAG TPA: tetratricopeptide repeat protein [Planctomycetota bacterium]|nr:tetratricopeptide repeat protein [Planctomycetota bacterium]
MKNRLIIVLIGVVAAAGNLAVAGEAPRDGGARLERALDRIRENAPPDIQALIDKQRGGEKLTAEEQQKLREFAANRFGNRMGNNAAPPEIRDLLAKRGRGEQLTKEEQQRLEEFQRDQINANRGCEGVARELIARGAIRDRFDARQPEFFVRVDANIHDAALLRAAEITHKQGKHQEAADMLAGIAKDSPQPEVVAAAHFTAGRIYRKNLLLPDKAAEEFLSVRGPMAEDAMREMTDMFLENGEPERAVKLLKDALLKAESKDERVAVMMAIVDACERAGQLDSAVTVLKEVADMFPYDEAMKLHMERDGRGAGEREPQR